MSSTPQATDVIDVLVVDDHPMIRDGLAHQLSATDDIRVAATAGSVAEATRQLAVLDVDVVLVDHQLGDGFGLDIVKSLTGAPTAVLLVTAYSDRGLIAMYDAAGSAGYLHKTSGPDALAAAVRATVTAGAFTDPTSAQRRAVSGVDSTATLSPRELEVLRGAARGLTNGAVGSQLGISGQTVKTHLSRVYMKLGVADRAHAVAVAQGRGLI